MADVQIHFLDVINDYLGKPAFTAQTAARLAGFSDLPEEALRAAAEKVIANTTGTPKLATLQKALQAADRVASIPMDTSVRPWDFETINRLEWLAELKAIGILQTQGHSLAMTADREGWLKRLLEFVVDYERLPLMREVDDLKRRSAAVKAEIEREDNGDLGPHLQHWHTNMLDATGRKVLGEAALVRAATVDSFKGRQKSAGTQYAERRAAEARLAEMKNEAGSFTLSPAALKIFGKAA